MKEGIIRLWAALWRAVWTGAETYGIYLGRFGPWVFHQMLGRPPKRRLK